MFFIHKKEQQFHFKQFRFDFHFSFWKGIKIPFKEKQAKTKKSIAKICEILL